MGRREVDGGVIIGTAGHIDHGKTTLVKALTGVDTDRLPEEKRRGITVELGFAPIDIGGVAASVIDVPGHEAFVKTMVAGAAGIDVALLVVAADEGLMPQTREHLAILELLEIPSLVVALTKTDAAEPEWRALVGEEVAAELSTTRWSGAPVVSCSAVTGEGFEDLKRELAARAPKTERGKRDDLFRLPIDRCFTMKGTGTVVTGTVWSGTLASDAAVRILPSGRTARVRRLQRHGTEVAGIHPGDRAAVALTGVEVGDVPRGSVIVTDGRWEATASLDVQLSLLPSGAAHLGERSAVRFHLGGADVGAAITFPDGDKDAAHRYARVRLDAPIAARGGDRFVLRLPSPVGTIGGGVVLDPYPGRRSVGTTGIAFRGIIASSADERFTCILGSAGPEGVAIDHLTVRLGMSGGAVDSVIAGSSCVVSEGRCFPRAELDAAKEAILSALIGAETTFPLERGVQLKSVSEIAECRHGLGRLAIAEMERSGSVVVAGSLVRRAGWSPSLSPDHERTVSSLVHAICDGNGEPPSAGELVEKYGGEVPGLLRYLEREGRVVQVAADRYYAPEAVDLLIEKLRKSLDPEAEYGLSQLRDTLGFSRKYLIPFLEYCDRAGVTERKGDGRTLRRVANP